ncbi:MAG: SDR family oxidoreductase [Saprospiraceae bacterium]
MNTSLKNKTALVGGASAGIGRATAIELAQLGATVIAIARTESKLQELVAELPTPEGQQHGYIAADYSDRAALMEKVNALLQSQDVHILINNSGGPPGGPITQATPEAFESALQMHLLVNQQLAQACLPGMEKAGYGRIINIISTSVKEPIDGLGVSNTTRWAVASWAKTWANEVGPKGVTVNNVLPGYTATDRLVSIIETRAQKSGKTTQEIEEQFKNSVPARRFAAPEEVAAAAAFLASPAAGYISGINLPVDGGRTRSM